MFIKNLTKLISITTIIVSLFFASATAKKINKVKAYYISLTGDTIKGVLKLPISCGTHAVNLESLQRKILFTGKDSMQHKLKPNQVKEYGYILNGKQIVMRAVKNNYLVGNVLNLNKVIFVKLITDGKLKQYEYTFKRYSSGGGFMATGPGIGGNFNNGYVYRAKRVFVQKNNDDAILLHPKKMKSQLKGYINDCNEVQKKLEDDSYSFKNIPSLIQDYNSCSQ